MDFPDSRIRCLSHDHVMDHHQRPHKNRRNQFERAHAYDTGFHVSDLILDSRTLRRGLSQASDGLDLGRNGSRMLRVAGSIAGSIVFGLCLLGLVLMATSSLGTSRIIWIVALVPSLGSVGAYIATKVSELQQLMEQRG